MWYNNSEPAGSGDSKDSARERMVSALRRKMGRESIIASEYWGREKTGSFQSKDRQRVFSALCRLPCSTAGFICTGLAMNAGVARWHLTKLARGGFVSHRASGRNILYWPSEMLDEEDYSVISQLRSGHTSEVLASILSYPGLTVGEIAQFAGISRVAVSTALLRLCSLDVVSTVGDGRFRRVYPTDMLTRFHSKKKKSASAFRSALLVRLRREGFSIQILQSTPELLSARITSKGRSSVLTVPLNPYDAFQSRAGIFSDILLALKAA